MKIWCLAALAFAITSFTATFAQLPTGYGNHYSPQELAVWRQRAVSGPYKSTGDVIPYSPGDWTRIVSFANAFKLNRYNAGNDNLDTRQIWTGSATQNGAESPVWQGFKMQAAGFYYLIKGDTSYGNAVRRSLLYQTTFPYAQVGTWPVTTPYEHGFGEANWLMRLLSAYDYTKGLFTTTERIQMETWFRASATYFCTRVTTGPIGQCFPKRLLDDYTVVSRDAQPGGIPLYAPDPIYPPSTALRHQWAGDGYIYTHKNADGSLGNKVSRLAMHYNNRTADKMSYVGQLGVLLNDAFFKLHAKQYAKEWIKYSVYPDNTIGEYERNGDYSNVNQGFQYGAKNVAQVVLLADALARKGDFSLYQFTTSQGAHNTIGGQKSLLSVLTRFGNNFIGADPIYYDSVSIENRIDDVTDYNMKMAVWDYLICISNKYYKSDFLKNIYKRTAVGAHPYNSNFTSVGGVWVPWSGPCGEMPGVLFMAGQLEDLNVYQYPCAMPTGIAAQGITQTNASISWDTMAMAAKYFVRYRTIGATLWTTDTVTTNTLAMSGLTANTGYQVQVQNSCEAGNASAWSATYSFTTLEPICQIPQNITINSVSTNGALVNADTVPGAISYSFDLRPQGSSTWATTTVSSLPVTLTLDPATIYEVRIRANCSATNSSEYTSVSSFTTGTPPCLAPDGLNATVLSTSAATMSWNPVAGVADYKLRLKPVSSTNWKFVVLTGTTHSEGSLLSGTRYEYQVLTNCQIGNTSGYTPSSFFTTQSPPCPVVTSVTVNGITQTAAAVNYASTGTGVLKYEIRYRKVGTTAWAVTSDAASPLALAGLTVTTNYEVQARALCSQDSSSFTASTIFTTATPPPPTCSTPTGFAAGSLLIDGATLAWAPVTGAVGYEVQYKTGSGAFITVSTTLPATVLTGLNVSTTYDAKVRTLCAASQMSAYSSLISFTTLSPVCGVPTGLSFSGITTTSASINWTRLAGVQSYNLQYRVAGNATWTVVSPAVSPLALASLTGATQYEVQIQAVCGAGNASAFSQSVTFSTVGQVCYTPINLTTDVQNEDSVYITWSGIPGNLGYKVLFYDPAHPTSPGRIDTVQGSHNGFTGFIPGRRYGVAIMTLCPIGTSVYSATSYFNMPSGCNATSTVRKEVWGSLNWQPGQPVPNRTPDTVTDIIRLEDSTRITNGNVLARVKGYICPPATGNYTYYLSGSEVAEVYLSTQGADSTTRQRIAYLTQPSGFRQFNSQPSATSVPVRLLRGQKYYLEVIYASQSSLAHFSLAWKTPEGESVMLISASRFSSSAGPAATVAIEKPVDLSNVYSLYPNPSSPSSPVYIAGPEGQAQVSISDATGKAAWQGSLTLGSSGEALPSNGLPSGLYLVQVLGKQGTHQTLRMVVK